MNEFLHFKVGITFNLTADVRWIGVKRVKLKKFTLNWLVEIKVNRIDTEIKVNRIDTE